MELKLKTLSRISFKLNLLIAPYGIETRFRYGSSTAIKNNETGKWEVWDFAYEENGERYYELHEFFEYKDAIEFWKIRNPKQK